MRNLCYAITDLSMKERPKENKNHGRHEVKEGETGEKREIKPV